MEKADTSSPLGTLSAEQINSFRAQYSIPIVVRTTSGERPATTINISKGGLAVEGLVEAPGSVIHVDVPLPYGVSVCAKGTVIWRSADGKTGIKFIDIDPDGESQLTAWLTERIKAEGWGQAVIDA